MLSLCKGRNVDCTLNLTSFRRIVAQDIAGSEGCSCCPHPPEEEERETEKPFRLSPPARAMRASLWFERATPLHGQWGDIVEPVASPWCHEAQVLRSEGEKIWQQPSFRGPAKLTEKKKYKPLDAMLCTGALPNRGNLSFYRCGELRRQIA